MVATWSICGQYVVGKPDQYYLFTITNIERRSHTSLQNLPNRQVLITILSNRNSKRQAVLSAGLPVAVPVIISVNLKKVVDVISTGELHHSQPLLRRYPRACYRSRLWLSCVLQSLTPGKNPSHTPQYVTNACRLQNAWWGNAAEIQDEERLSDTGRSFGLIGEEEMSLGPGWEGGGCYHMPYRNRYICAAAKWYHFQAFLVWNRV